MAEEKVSQEQKPAGGGKGILIALIALIVILLIAIVGGGYFLYQSINSNQQGTNQTQSQALDTDDSSIASFKVEINDMVLNITSSKGKEKLMKLSFSLNSTEEGIQGLIDSTKPEIMDLVISVISSRNSEELLTVGGKELLKEELIEGINSILNKAVADSDMKRNSVKDIFFTSFVIK